MSEAVPKIALSLYTYVHTIDPPPPSEPETGRAERLVGIAALHPSSWCPHQKHTDLLRGRSVREMAVRACPPIEQAFGHRVETLSVFCLPGDPCTETKSVLFSTSKYFFFLLVHFEAVPLVCVGPFTDHFLVVVQQCGKQCKGPCRDGKKMEEIKFQIGPPRYASSLDHKKQTQQGGSKLYARTSTVLGEHRLPMTRLKTA